ncbi:hypothetical protein WR25_16786 [Diploscapter pachys]|uniref:Uncharacterized protein n=1 Tax=Diploscapter pachys TaxID=2018661 RepID=A0A2A2LJF0_9BILA|nr:hypothetical protein WR25_16786 [Diploscapter pachys]
MEAFRRRCGVRKLAGVLVGVGLSLFADFFGELGALLELASLRSSEAEFLLGLVLSEAVSPEVPWIFSIFVNSNLSNDVTISPSYLIFPLSLLVLPLQPSDRNRAGRKQTFFWGSSRGEWAWSGQRREWMSRPLEVDCRRIQMQIDVEDSSKVAV